MNNCQLSVAKCAVPVTSRLALANIVNSSDIDIIEIYLDSMGEIDSDFLSILINTDKSKIITSRQPQFAKTYFDDIAQFERIQKIYDIADYFDFDIFHEKYLIDNFVSKFGSKKLISSFHNYLESPTNTQIDSIIEQMIKLNPAICKLAWNCQSDEDLMKMLQTASKLKSSNVNFVLSPMGTLGIAGRMVLAVSGMLFVYCSEGANTTATGQITVENYKNFISMLGLSR